MTQGDQSITDFCQWIKTAIDAFHNIGYPVSKSLLVLNLLSDVNLCFSNMADSIACVSTPFLRCRMQCPRPKRTSSRQQGQCGDSNRAVGGLAMQGSSCSSRVMLVVSNQGCGGNTTNKRKNDNNNSKSMVVATVVAVASPSLPLARHNLLGCRSTFPLGQPTASLMGRPARVVPS
uniref:Uncharacterized protein n=1 Tax=Oryza brachyantha TaxID=4533 RepID=J3M5U7_ORYBR